MFDDVYPLYPMRAIHRLDGIWEFKWLGDVANDDVAPQSLVYDDVQAVPGVFDTGLDLCNARVSASTAARWFAPVARCAWSSRGSVSTDASSWTEK